MNDTNLLHLLISALAAKQPVAVPVAVGTHDSTILAVQLILAALGPVLAGAASWFAARAMRHTEDSKREIVVLKEHINSRMSELLRTSGESAHAAGVTEGRSEVQIQHTPMSKELEGLRRLLTEAQAQINLLRNQKETP